MTTSFSYYLENSELRFEFFPDGNMKISLCDYGGIHDESITIANPINFANMIKAHANNIKNIEHEVFNEE